MLSNNLAQSSHSTADILKFEFTLRPAQEAHSLVASAFLALYDWL
jgi:hypothetical protein